MNTFSSYMMTMLLQTIVWPGLIVAAGILFGQLVLLHRLTQESKPIVSALAIGAGYLTSYALIYGQFSFPPQQALDWLPLLLLAVLVVFTVDDAIGFASWLRMILQGAAVLLAGSLLLYPILNQATLASAALNLAGVTAIWFGLWTYLDRRAPQDSTSGVTLLVVAVGSAIVFIKTGSILLGQLGGALAAVLGGWLLWNWPQSRWLLGHAGTAVTVLVLGSLLLVGRFYSETPTSIGLLLLLALVANLPVALIARYKANLSTRLTAVLTSVIAVGLVALAVGLTVLFYTPEVSNYGRY